MPLNKSQKLKAIIAKTNEFMANQYPEDWAVIKYFIKTIKNPFVLWHYYKKILLALRIPIIEEPIENEVYIDDILRKDNLTEEEKQEDIEFRKEYHKDATIWFHRAKYGESTGITASTLRELNDGAYQLKDFGYENMEELKGAETKQIKVVQKVDILSDCSDVVKLDCKYLEKESYKRYEPAGSVTQNQPGQVYLPHTAIKKINRVQGRNSDVCFLLDTLLEAIIRYQSCAIGMALEVRSEAKICSLSKQLTSMEERLGNRIDTAVSTATNTIVRKLDDKKEAVKNSQSKGVLLLRIRSVKVREIFGADFNPPRGQYIYYIHGGLDSRWSEYTEDKKNYIMVRSFKNISDHDKFLREVKEELYLEDSTIKPKRNYLMLTDPQLDQVIGCYSQRDAKCAIET